MDGIIADYRTKDNRILIEASKIADKFNVPLFYLRSPKKHGLMRKIEGDLNVLAKCEDIIMVSRYISI